MFLGGALKRPAYDACIYISQRMIGFAVMAFPIGYLLALVSLRLGVNWQISLPIERFPIVILSRAPLM